MAKHHPDLIFCRKQAGVAIGRLCEKCDGKCVICDSYVRPCTLVRICDECNYGSYQGRCVICGGPGVSDAYYCKECTIQEKDCPEAEMGLAHVDFAPFPGNTSSPVTRCSLSAFPILVEISACAETFLQAERPLYCSLAACIIYKRDGCPKIVNLGSSKTDLFYERKKYGFKKR
uniref:PHD finger protein 5A n=1 Tax=Oryctolagus cuniculus TaxID=9986 RepID=A0A5F9DC21_RABIT